MFCRLPLSFFKAFEYIYFAISFCILSFSLGGRGGGGGGVIIILLGDILFIFILYSAFFFQIT